MNSLSFFLVLIVIAAVAYIDSRVHTPPPPDPEIARDMQWHLERPWSPLVFRLEDLERTDNSFAFRARGDHKGREFGFRLRFTHTSGRFAVCEWWRTGEDSEAIVDMIAECSKRPRDEGRFDDS